MPHLIAVVFAVAVAASTARADTSASHDVKNTKNYGNCVVSTLVDMFTDEEIHGFLCEERTLTDTTRIGVNYQAGAFFVMLSKGLHFYMPGESVPVAFRIDKGRLIKRSVQRDSNNADRVFIRDSQLAHSLLNDLAHGQRAAIQVGSESGHVRLSGSQRAVADFRQRAGLQHQQTLTLEQRLNIPANNR